MIVWTLIVCPVTLVLAKGAAPHERSSTAAFGSSSQPRYSRLRQLPQKRKRTVAVPLDLRGGGASSYSSAHASPHPWSASGERLASAWQHAVWPRLEALRHRFTTKLDEMTGSEREQDNATRRVLRSKTSNNRDGNADVPATTVSSILVPSRVFKLALLAWLLAEGLERVGILYEDAPALLKSRLGDFWCFHLQPKLIRCKERCQLFYWNRIEPLLPDAVLYSDFYNAPLSSKILLQSLSTTKVAFALGAAVGMLASPLLAQAAAQHWRPILAVYGLAEVNHYCTKRGQKFVQWLGETPQTLGATLDGILNQVRSLVRRILLGEKQLDNNGYFGGYFGAVNRLSYAGNTRLPLLGGGDDNARHFNKSRKSQRNGVSEEESDFQMLLDDFKEWMVANGPQRHSAPSLLPPSRFSTDSESEEKRQFATKGFLIGCGIGLAFFRV